MTQAILLAYLCDRYHDLATYASESLKQRVHFMAKPDGSNLKDLFIWDTPLSTRSLGQNVSPRWTPSQIQDYIHQHWSADQFPLHPPNNCNSWEAAKVYFKELDQETVQAIVPIGVQRDEETKVDEVTLLVVLTAELDSGDQDKGSSEGGGRPAGGTVGGGSASKQGKRTVWRYHDMVAVNETNWEQNGWTILLPKHSQIQEPTSSDKITGTGTDKQSGDEEKDEQDDGEDDSDDDYWGQYGDAEDESAADETSGKSKDNQDPSGAASEAPLDQDAEEELYWRKYSEQQEEQDELERKKKMPEQQHSLEHPAAAAAGLHHLDPQESSKASTPLPGQVDPNMLSSLLQSLVMDGVQQMYPTSFSELDQQHQGPLLQQHHATVDFPVATSALGSISPLPSAAPLHKDKTSHPADSGDSQSKLMDSMRSLVADSTRAGYTKDQVFAMMESVYNTQ
ncbi:hypothetical protein BGX30_003747 [Mortierella sp. GBA39]|nr:hypothetical protein BGX30_003747 [Mortierella sp. GBA39]